MKTVAQNYLFESCFHVLNWRTRKYSAQFTTTLLVATIFIVYTIDREIRKLSAYLPQTSIPLRQAGRTQAGLWAGSVARAT